MSLSWFGGYREAFRNNPSQVASIFPPPNDHSPETQHTSKSGGVTPGDYKRAVRYLHALADKTGGRFYSGDSLFGITQAFTWVAEKLGRQHSIGYCPSTAGKEGERRQVKVRTTESDLVVKARDSYIYSAREQKFTPVTGNRIDPASANFRD